MVEVMKTMATSFRRSHARTAAVIAPSPAAGLHPPTPALETPGHSQASLGQSLAGSLLRSPGPLCTMINTHGGIYMYMDFPADSYGKESTCNVGDLCPFPGLGGYPG